jgi:GT2 family glycosyltransferase
MDIRPTPLVSIVVITYQGKNLVLRCLDSIHLVNYEPLEVLVVDNGSNDGTVAAIHREFPDVRVIVNEKNEMLAEARNIGFREAKAEFVFLIDNDNVLHPMIVSELVKELIRNPKIGMIGPVAYYLSNQDKIWSAGSNISMLTSLAHHLNEKDLLSVADSSVAVLCIPNAFIVQRSAINQVGLFDNKQYPIGLDEGDMGKRLYSAGYQVRVVKTAHIYHDIPEPDKGISGLLRRLHFGGTGQSGKIKAYYHGRNRILFMRQYAGLNFWFFILLNVPITAAYMILCLLNFRFDLFLSFTRGVIDGIIMTIRIKKILCY